MPETPIPALVGRWLHSHEEDTATTRVYRRASFPFPPSRGRAGFEFRDGEHCVIVDIAPRDGHAEQEARWRQEPTESGGLQISMVTPAGDARTLHVLAVEPDRVVVRR